MACPHVAGGVAVAYMEGDFRYTKSLVAYGRRGVYIHLPFYGWSANIDRNDSILLNVTNAALHDVITVSCKRQAEVIQSDENVSVRSTGQGEAENTKCKRPKQNCGQTSTVQVTELPLQQTLSRVGRGMVCTMSGLAEVVFVCVCVCVCARARSCACTASVQVIYCMYIYIYINIIYIILIGRVLTRHV